MGIPDMAIGNVIGSNILNVLLVLGLVALLGPLRINRRLFKGGLFVMVGAAVLMFLLSLDGVLGRWDGLLLILVMGFYTLGLFKFSKQEGSTQQRSWPLWTLIPAILLGSYLLFLGSGWFVGGAVGIAESLGASKLVIGLTILALGTSLPELATFIVASIRKEADLGVGNIIGSCIFNILVAQGVCSFLVGEKMVVSYSVLSFNLPMMIAVSILCIPVFYTDRYLSRGEGVLFLFYYVCYILCLTVWGDKVAALPVVLLGAVVYLTLFYFRVLQHYKEEKL